MDTIFALSTAQGRAGVAIIRISGPDALKITSRLCRVSLAPRVATYVQLQTQSGEHLDDAIVLFFPGPASFTGDDVIELQLHGSIAVVNAVQRALGQFQDCRLAEPGEFTRRALVNGKMDLTQVEGLRDLIDAETEAQRQQAQLLNSGKLTQLVNDLQHDLVRAAALIATVIDFSDEELPDDVSRETKVLIENCSAILDEQIQGYEYAEMIRTGFEVAIVGRPNIGKSSLLNAIAKRDVAITSDIEGTTRDVIEVRLDLAGIPVTILDTAGIRDTDDNLEKEGISRALTRAKASDLRLILTDNSYDLPLKPSGDDLVVVTKSDLGHSGNRTVSAKTGAGVDDLLASIADILKDTMSNAGLATHERHLAALSASQGNLAMALHHIHVGDLSLDLAAEEIRSALRHLDSVLGKVDIEDLLDVVFASFCLGK